MSEIVVSEVHGVSDSQHAHMEEIMDELADLDTGGTGIEIHEMLHAGCYVRTAFIPAGRVFVSAQILVPTVLIVCGDIYLTDTERTVRIQGYEVLTGARMRQGIVRTLKDTYMTAFFATDAKTCAEAEASAVADVSRLWHDQRDKEHVLGRRRSSAR